jgi:phosphomannomutase
MSEPIISVSGLRGIVGDSLTPLIASQYVSAFASGLPQGGSIVVTRDGRVSGPMLAGVICSTLQACGFDVLYADVAATPTTGVLVRQLKAVAGIQISASHNPPPYNGIKLFSADGRVISATAGQRVIDDYRAERANFCGVDQLGKLSDVKDTITAHLQRVLNTVNRERIRKCNFRVVLDSNHGAGSVLGGVLLEELGCQVEILGGTPDGLFAHPPEPTASNLQSVAEKARSIGADVVFCQDPDADRLAVIDENGTYIGEEYTLALTLDHALSQIDASGRSVVTNCSSSRMSADIAKRHGAKYQMSAVGEANVTQKMVDTNAVYGGEGNGGPIDPRVGYVRDSFAAMAQILDSMSASGKRVSELVAGLPRYEIHKTTLPLPQQFVPALLDQLAVEFSDAKADRQDGLRLDWPNRWLLVRPSNTEPIVRAIAEANDLADAQNLCERTAEIARALAK